MKTFFACLISFSVALPCLSNDALGQVDFASSSTLTQGSSTTDDGSDSKNRKPEGPKYDEFKRIVKENREVSAEIDQLFGSMPVGFPKLQAAQQEKINLLKKREIVLSSQLMDAAIAAFREGAQSNTGQDKRVMNLVLKAMTGNIQPKTPDQRFDPKAGLELANLLTKSGFEQPGIYFQAFRAAFAIQDFERAELMLQKIEAMGTKLPETAKERLLITKANWQKELEIRLMESASDDLPRARIETSAGSVDVELFENHAPVTVANFINLVEKRYYDGQIFHLVRPGLIAETGCPNGDGTGHPGYRIPCECYGEALRHHFIGSLAMANKGKDTAGSQFYFTLQPNPVLDGRYTVFGRVMSSMDPLNKLKAVNKVKTDSSDINEDLVTIRRITILRKRNHTYEPTVLPLEAKPEAPVANNPAANEGSSTTDDAQPMTPRTNPLLPTADPAANGETPANGSGTTEGSGTNEGSGTTVESSALKAAKEALEGAREILGSDKK